MPLSFPGSPSNGDIYTSGDQSWEWVAASSKWVRVAPSGALAVGEGGTGATTAAGARTNLGLAAPTIQKFLADGTWNRPTNCKYVRVRVQAGGGGGAGSAGAAASQVAFGTPGGSGGYAEEWIDVTAISSVAVTVGAQGTGGAAGANAGVNGGDSSFGAHAVAQGGVGGSTVASGTAVSVTAGGAGGAVSAGEIQVPGDTGDVTVRLSGTSVIPPASGGGDALFGNGGVTPAINANGNNATGYGAGGSGCISSNSGGTKAGGNGSPGIVIVEEFY